MTRKNTLDKTFEEKAKLLLDSASNDLDPQTSRRLQQIRQHALASTSSNLAINWKIPVAGFASLGIAIVMTVSMWTSKPVEVQLTIALDDIELFTATESIDFFDQLEFYAWLDEIDAQS